MALTLAAAACALGRSAARPLGRQLRCRPPPRSLSRCGAHAAPAGAALRPPARQAQLVASVAAREARLPPPSPTLPLALSQGVAISLPAWLALALCAFLAIFAGLFGAVLFALLPVLREVALSAGAVRTACAGVVTACDEVEKLSILMQHDIRQVEEGISKPLATLSKVAGNLPGATTLQGIMEDPDTKLLQSVAGSMRGATEKSIRDRVRKWVISLDNMRVRLQAEEPPERPRRGLAAAGAPRSAAIRPRDAASAAGVERAAVEAWAGAASAVAAAETATAKLEDVLDTCQSEGACADEAALAAAAKTATQDAADAALDAATPPSNPS